MASRSSAEARFNEMRGFALLAGALFLATSLFTFHPSDLAFFSSTPSARVQNLCGVAGAYLAAGVRTVLGLAGYLIPAVFLLWAVAGFLGKPPSKRYAQVIGFLGFCVASSSLLSILWVQDVTARAYRGGLVGLSVGDWLLHYCGFLGAVIVALTVTALSFLLATEMLLVPVLSVAGFSLWRSARAGAARATDWVRARRGAVPVHVARAGRRASTPSPNSAISIRIAEGSRAATVIVEEPATSAADPSTSGGRGTPAPSIAAPERLPLEEAAPRASAQPAPRKPAPKPASVRAEAPVLVGDYHLPPLNLLNDPPPPETRQLKDDLQTSANVLQETLMDFGIQVHVAQVEQGPVITRYELEPAPGVKLTRITGLADDIALALKAPSVRIIAPIPGKARVGVEVPNTQASLVNLREVLESPAFRQASSKLTLALGKDTAGHALVADLGGMPHLLIAGTTGAGKTVCVNGLIMSLLLTSTPEEVKFLMVDPKMVELAIFNGLPHLITPVQTEPRRVSKALNWVVQEMENRYKLFARLGLRNIESYHQKHRARELPLEEVPASLPYLVVIVDELADLMMVARTEVETAIGRLAQLSRAVGIHMVLATQRPSVDVLTGVIKANFSARISFQVASKVDARTVLDQVGAEKLVGKGDLLFMKPGAAKLIRAQGCLVTDEEIERVTAFIKQQRPAHYDETIFEDTGRGPGGQVIEKDLMYDEAVQVILNAGQASVSLLQRRLRLGYGRAARILDMMEQEGIVGPIQGAKPREVLITTYPGSTPTDDASVRPVAAEGDA